MQPKYLIFIFLFLLFSCEKENETALNLKFYGDAYEDIGYSIAANSQGEYLIAGTTTLIEREPTSAGSLITGSSKKMIVLKTDAEGKQLGDPLVLGGSLEASGFRVLALDDGSSVAAGTVTDPETLTKDIYVVKVGPDVSSATEAIFISEGNQTATDIVKTPGGFIILGTTDIKREPVTEYTGNAAGKKDVLILRLNDDLVQLTPVQPVGFIGNDEGAAIKEDAQGGYIIAGTTDRSEKVSSEQAGTNIFIFRINSDGSTTQPRILGGTRNETASDLEVLDDGYLISGTIGNEGTDQQAYLWKLPFNIYSDPEFSKEIDLNGSTANISYSVKAMCRYRTSSFLLAGQHGTGLSSRMLIFSVDAFGNLVEDRIMITGGTGSQSVNDVIADEFNNIIAVGRNSYENNSMITFLKFRF
jgi:hypothetical protein